jgi:cytoskeletal protein CcmA (bactofilin family)
VSGEARGPASVIGRGTRIEGNVQFSGALVIEGSVHGEVRGEGKTPASVAIGRDGNVIGAMARVDLRSEGRLEGVVTDAGLVELRADSHTSGEIGYAVLDVQRGAVLDCLLKPQRPASD